ncbi:hypothetical protein [Paenibacillus sp. PL2-23]|uniref:hypothetical protein n=1 Tax=Paenibacillus sp. PL2-23 TaxID=2100729 RepID=UPI0030F87877
MPIAGYEQAATAAGGGNRSAAPPERQLDHAWRVGSLSMGITLMLIGTAFAVSLWQDAEAYELLMWVAPVIFILLGVELLIYVSIAGKRSARVRYDWLSVLFVGLIGAGSVVLALLMSSGLFEEIQRDMRTTQRTAFVEAQKVEVPAGVESLIVIAPSGLAIEHATSRELLLMGQVRYWSAEAYTGAAQEMLRTQAAGSSMYIWIGTPEWEEGAKVTGMAPQLILTVPEGVTVERRFY